MTTKDDTKDKPDAASVKKAHDEVGTRAPNATTRPGMRSADIKPEEKKKDYHGMPDGYKPDHSVKYVKGKKEDGSEDHIVNEKGEKLGVGAYAPSGPKTDAMQALDKDHTYRDRVEAEAKDLGITVDPAWTMEYLMDVIRWNASS